VRQLVELITSGIQPHHNTGTLAAVGRFTSPENVKEWARAAIARGLAALEVFAGAYAGQHFMGEAVTLADAWLVPQMYAARRFEVDVSPYPKLVELDARASAIPAFARAHPDRQIDAPRP
jgi:maleylpyruvate isomerase